MNPPDSPDHRNDAPLPPNREAMLAALGYYHDDLVVSDDNAVRADYEAKLAPVLEAERKLSTALDAAFSDHADFVQSIQFSDGTDAEQLTLYLPMKPLNGKKQPDAPLVFTRALSGDNHPTSMAFLASLRKFEIIDSNGLHVARYRRTPEDDDQPLTTSNLQAERIEIDPGHNPQRLVERSYKAELWTENLEKASPEESTPLPNQTRWLGRLAGRLFRGGH